ncbi:Clavesin-1-like [Homarus americanus]|uniref:Clavesin-1-like n=1 Tax=Homarus americanus TaxID=6706 RepID=A0A8J5MV04_HOMAM|nr:Clavesin-1-like [Homarus americanus]
MWVRLVMPLPPVSESQRRVMLARPGHRDPTTTSMDDVARTILLTLDLLLEEDETIGVTGMLVVMDTGEITFQHAAQMTPTIMKKMATLIQVHTHASPHLSWSTLMLAHNHAGPHS